MDTTGKPTPGRSRATRDDIFESPLEDAQVLSPYIWMPSAGGFRTSPCLFKGL